MQRAIAEKTTVLKPGPVAEYKYVRTDSRMNQLESFGYSVQPKRQRIDQGVEEMDIDQPTPLIEITKRPRVEVRLTSLLQLRKEVKKNELIELTTIFQNHTFIGCVDDSLALIQCEQDIYLINYNIAR